MIDNVLYAEDIKHTASLVLPWDKFENCSILVTGASGLLGSFLVDTLMYKNKYDGLNCSIYAVVRNINRAEMCFKPYLHSDYFNLISHDINSALTLENANNIEYVLHMASNTHPIAYATDPIGTITANIVGTKNMLDFSVKCNAKRFIFASSNEIYGENRGDVELFDEYYCGYIDSNTLRAGYPESKRCGEALCQAYIKQMGLDVVIPRFTRSYGPTMLMNDSKAVSQFIRKAVAGEDIILKSTGTQLYSYTYVSDAVSGLLTIILKGKTGNAYNIADEKSDIMLKDLAALLANIAGRNVVFEIPDEVEKSGYSTATKARLDGSKLKDLGWKPQYDIYSGMKRNLKILQEIV